MISQNLKNKLMANWGEKADSMACMAEVRIYDPLSPWECYIFAMNPEDEDEIACIFNGYSVEVCDWRLSEMATMFNELGENPLIDYEYRPRQAAALLKKLTELEPYGNQIDQR